MAKYFSTIWHLILASIHHNNECMPMSLARYFLSCNLVKNDSFQAFILDIRYSAMNCIKREHCYKVKDQLIIEGLFVDCRIMNPITNIREQSHICSLNHFLITCDKWLIDAIFSVYTASEYAYVITIFCCFSFLATLLNSMCRTGHMTFENRYNS